MTHSSSELAGRIRSSVKEWFHCRMQECVRCCECGGAVSPWDSHCPTCGQENPARVSASAVVFLVLGFALLSLTLSSLISPSDGRACGDRKNG